MTELGRPARSCPVKKSAGGDARKLAIAACAESPMRLRSGSGSSQEFARLRHHVLPALLLRLQQLEKLVRTAGGAIQRQRGEALAHVRRRQRLRNLSIEHLDDL